MAEIHAPSTTANALGITLAPTVDHEAGLEPYQVAAPYVSAIPQLGARHSHVATIARDAHVRLYNTPSYLVPIVAGRVLIPRR